MWSSRRDGVKYRTWKLRDWERARSCCGTRSEDGSAIAGAGRDGGKLWCAMWKAGSSGDDVAGRDVKNDRLCAEVESAER